MGTRKLLGKTYSNYSSSLQSTIVLAGPLDLLTGSVAEKVVRYPRNPMPIAGWERPSIRHPTYTDSHPHSTESMNQPPPFIFCWGNMMIPLEINLPVPNWLNSINAPRFQVYRFGLHGCWNTTPWFQPLADDAARIFAADLNKH